MNPYSCVLATVAVICATALAWTGKISFSSENVTLMVGAGCAFVAGWAMPQMKFANADGKSSKE